MLGTLRATREFLSTPSVRRATFARGPSRRGCRSISIHALREEGDRSSPTTSPARCNFYPRPP